jgi:fibronectin-binding autotransporter adhesin
MATKINGIQLSYSKAAYTGSKSGDFILDNSDDGLIISGSRFYATVETPVTDGELASKAYVDSQTGGSAVSTDEVVFGKSGGGFDSNEQFKLEGTQDGGKAFNAVLNTGTTGSFRASGRMFQVTGSVNVAEAISLKSTTGAASTIVVENTAGTDEGAIELTSTAGGVDINAAASKDVAINGGQVLLTSAHDVANSIYLRANAGTSETIKIHSDLGSGAGSIELTSDAGGIDVNAAGAISLDSSAGSIDVNVVDGQTVKVGLNGAVETIWTPHGTAGSEAWSTINTSGDTDGTDAAGAILLSAVAGGIGLAWADDKDLWMEGGRAVVTANEDAADAIKLHADAGSSQTITLVNDAGTAVSDTAAAVQLTSTLGAVTLAGGVANAAALRLKATDAAGGIDIDAGTGGVAIDSTGAISIDSAGAASNFSHTATEPGAGGGDLTIAMDGSVDCSLVLSSAGTGADALQLRATAGGIDMVSVGVAGEDIDIDATTSSVNVTGSEAERDAVKILADTAAGGIQLQVADADGIAVMGNVSADTYVKVTSNSSAASELIAIVNSAGTSATEGAAAVQLLATAGGVNVKGNLDGADAVLLTADGGTSATMRIHNDQGAGVSDTAASVQVTSDAGAITLNAGVANAAAIRLKADTNAAGGVDIDAGTGGVAIDSTGAISIDASAASNVSTSAGNLTIQGASQLIMSGASVQLSGSGNAVYGVGNSFTDSVTHTFYHGGLSLLSISSANGLATNGSLQIPVNFSGASGVLMPSNFWLTGSSTAANGTITGFEIGSSIGASLQTDSDAIKVYLNGIRQLAGSSADYMLSSSNGGTNRYVSFTTAPVSGDVVLFDYSRISA